MPSAIYEGMIWQHTCASISESTSHHVSESKDEHKLGYCLKPPNKRFVPQTQFQTSPQRTFTWICPKHFQEARAGVDRCTSQM